MIKHKNYLVITKDNEVILDISFKNDNDPAIIKDGYELHQSDDPYEVIVNENGDIFLYES